MINSMRRLYNTVDRLFDRQAIQQDVNWDNELNRSDQPKTARQAFASIQKTAQDWDTRPQLKLISAPEGVDADGTARRWEFFFDLPSRRARLECDWSLQWDSSQDDYAGSQIEARVRPFPELGSKLYRMVNEGLMLYRQLHGLWREERRRTPDLPTAFRDSDEVMDELIKLGLVDPTEEIVLNTGQTPSGVLSWVAHTRHDKHFASLE